MRFGTIALNCEFLERTSIYRLYPVASKALDMQQMYNKYLKKKVFA